MLVTKEKKNSSFWSKYFEGGPNISTHVDLPQIGSIFPSWALSTLKIYYATMIPHMKT